MWDKKKIMDRENERLKKGNNEKESKREIKNYI